MEAVCVCVCVYFNVVIVIVNEVDDIMSKERDRKRDNKYMQKKKEKVCNIRAYIPLLVLLATKVHLFYSILT